MPPAGGGKGWLGSGLDNKGGRGKVVASVSSNGNEEPPPNDGNHNIISSRYSTLKVFQSIMTQVGSNGGILGAHPNDALPI